MVNFEITKTQKIKEVNNNMCHNYYYLIYGRFYNEDRTKYRKFKYVIWFDIFDMQEYYGKDFITNEEIKNYVDNLIFGISYTYHIKNFDDEKKLKEFYKYCNETIDEYNKCNIF